ncbi:MAG: response regulator [Anaerolineae bacterium]|nr:response regulator [Anaerolineae bacterium]
METRVLIVEDDRVIAQDIQQTLARLGYAYPMVVSSGEEAIQRTADLKPDLVLMDIQLKGSMDGIEAAQQIRACFDIPVVYLTAYADDLTLRRARITGPFGYILKPFEDRELHSVIEMALQRHEMEQALARSGEQFRALVEGASDIAMVLDGSGVIRYASPALEHVIGYGPKELGGRRIFKFLHADSVPEVQGVVERCVRDRVPIQAIVLLFRHKDGSWCSFEGTAQNLLDRPAVRGIVLSCPCIIEKRWIGKWATRM